MKKLSIERRVNRFVVLLAFLILLLEFALIICLDGIITGGRQILFLLFLFAADLFLVLLYWQLVLKPAAAVRQQIKAFLQGRAFEELFSPEYQLTDEFPWMLEKFHTLLDSEKILEMTVEQARYLALQNQINPHFLYNTLDAIRTDALLAGVKAVAKTTEALATYFRYTISNLDRYATLTEELNNVEDYMTIQMYRFGDRLKLDMTEIDPECKENCLPRITLQPIVENAIYHGLEAKRKMGTVTIQVHATEERMLIHVIDDGIGIDNVQLEKINATIGRADSGHARSQQTRGGIALKNVNSRIKLLFGEQYGLQVFSEPGTGTDVRIDVPIVKRSELDEQQENRGPEVTV